MWITSSQKAYELLKDEISREVEEFWALALASNKAVIARRCLFRGTVDACLVHPRDIFRFGCLHNASSLLVAHNHPSQELLPSRADVVLTRKIVALGKMMQIPVIDHLIIGHQGYRSFLDEKWEPF